MPPAYFYRKYYGFQDKYEYIKTITYVSERRQQYIHQGETYLEYEL
jgi:hypothetical protein